MLGHKWVNDQQYVFSILHHFAEDNNLIFSSKKLGTTESIISCELKHLVQWLRGSKLSLNETRSKLAIFRSPWT